jgi:hypothetical protein
MARRNNARLKDITCAKNRPVIIIISTAILR